MTTVYVVSEHPLLSVKAKALREKDEDAFAEQVALAANLLGVDETTYTGDTLAKVNRALVLQLNYQLLLDPDVFLHKSAASQHSKQSILYRGGDGGPPLVMGQAMAIIKEIRYESGWDNMRAVR